MNYNGVVFVNELSHPLAASTVDTREISFTFQRKSLAIQSFNAICLNGSFAINNADHVTLNHSQHLFLAF